MSIIRKFINIFHKTRRLGYSQIYVSVDIHETILKPTWSIYECNVDRTLCSKCSSCEYAFTDKGLVRIYSKELQIFKIIQRDSIHCFRVF